MGSKLYKFVEFMQFAIRAERGIKVFIEMPDLEEPETISNPACNVKTKMEYYKKAYNEDLELKTFNAIKISGYELLEK